MYPVRMNGMCAPCEFHPGLSVFDKRIYHALILERLLMIVKTTDMASLHDPTCPCIAATLQAPTHWDHMDIP